MGTDSIKKLYTRRALFYQFLFLNVLGYGRSIERIFRSSDVVRSGFKILDVGCGTGNITKILHSIAHERGYKNVIFQAFDVTQAMLDIFQRWIQKARARGIVVRQADVLHLETLPHNWSGYDRIIVSAMLEHLPKERIAEVLDTLRRLLKNDGKLIAVITKRTLFTRIFIEKWWETNLYDAKELENVFLGAGFTIFKITKTIWGSLFFIEAGNKTKKE